MTGEELLRPFAEGNEDGGIELPAMPWLGNGETVAEGTLVAFKSALFEGPVSSIGLNLFGT